MIEGRGGDARAALIPRPCRMKNTGGGRQTFAPCFHECGVPLRETHAEGIALQGRRG